MKIGVLAVQGDYYLHQKVLDRLNISHIQVKNPEQLTGCDGLIIPGGESTTFMKMLQAAHMVPAIRQFASKKAIFGTCAGLIILAGKVNNHGLDVLNLIDIKVDRNSYGRQIDSFIDQVQLKLPEETIEFEGVFIRAPRIISAGEGIRILGNYKKDIILAEDGHILVATFHPELTNDTRIHEYFLQKVKRFMT